MVDPLRQTSGHQGDIDFIAHQVLVGHGDGSELFDVGVLNLVDGEEDAGAFQLGGKLA